MRFILFILLLCTSFAQGATYYVRKTGNDSNPGTTGSPWLTIGKAATVLAAGDTVIIGDGDYNEHVQETTSGSAGSLITYQAENQGLASLRAFRLTASYVKLDGLTLSKYSAVGNTWNSAIRVDTTSNNCTVTNCTIKDLPGVIAHDFSFNSAEQRITSASSDFVAAGFEVGSKVYLGASGATIDGVSLFYVNHDQTWQVATVAATTMTLTNGSDPFLDDTGTNYWAFIRAGTTNDGFAAVDCILSGGDGPDNFTLTNTTITNWCGHAIRIRGTGALVEGNTLTNLRSFRAFDYGGSNHVFRRNIVKNCPNVLHYASDEPLIHPPGTGWYDYQAGMFSGFTASGDHQNILFEENWFEDLENQMGRVDDQLTGAYGITFQRNVFVGITAHFSGGRDDMKWYDNTFVRCSFGVAPHALQLGGSAPAQTGYELKRNLFVACGFPGEEESQTRGFYNISANATAPVTSQNFVAGEELLGFASKSGFTEPDGINGGNPLFVDIRDPDGPDNTPWTADDGLKVLPTSPVAGIGGGALGVRAVVSGQPVAHFKVSSPIGWWEGYGESYDPEWLNELPTQRGRPARPYDVPPAFVGVPITITFDAAASISGVGGATTNTAITNYAWNWGDGSAVTNTASTTASHTFTTPGDRTVTLTVTNSSGSTSTYSSVYRLPGPALRVPADYLTIQEAMDAASPGDTILVSSGTYNETLRTNVAGTSGSRIILEGEEGVVIKQFYFEDAYWTVRNINFKGVVPEFQRYVWFRRGGHFGRLESCTVDCEFRDGVAGIDWEGPTVKPLGPDAASDCVVTDCEVRHVFQTRCLILYGARNLIEQCLFEDVQKADFIRAFGENNTIRRNVFRNNYGNNTPGNHPDFIQTFGLNGYGSQDLLIEYNYIEDILTGGLAQLEGNLIPEIGRWTFRNNVFVRVGNTTSCSIPNVTVTNNVFYQCNAENDGNDGHILNFGSRGYGPEGSVVFNFAHGATVKNNVFLECGDNSGSVGWYTVNSPGGPLTGTTFNWNYVARDAFAPMDQNTVSYPDPAYDINEWYEPNGINGGDPLFVNVADPDGPDNQMWTGDDGFQPLTGSILLGAGEDGVDIGAYSEGVATPPTPAAGSINAGTVNATTVTVQ